MPALALLLEIVDQLIRIIQSIKPRAPPDRHFLPVAFALIVYNLIFERVPFFSARHDVVADVPYPLVHLANVLCSEKDQ